MKNLKQVIKEIDALQARTKEKDCDSAEKKKITKRVIILTQVKYYLEKDPREEFCKEEKIRLARVLDAAYDSWNKEYQSRRESYDKLPMKRITELKNEYLKEVPVALMKMQIKTLDYILS